MRLQSLSFLGFCSDASHVRREGGALGDRALPVPCAGNLFAAGGDSPPENANIIANNQPRGWRIIADLRLREITVRTKSRHICRGKAVASERRPYQGGATDLHPALSSPSATPLRSRGYAARLSEPTERRQAQMLRRKTRLMEGEARDEGASAELSDMQRRGSSDAR